MQRGIEKFAKKSCFRWTFREKGRRKGLKGDSDVTRENVHSKHRGAASSEVAESAAKESTFLPLFPSSPLPFPLLLRLPLGLLPALPRENRFFFFFRRTTFEFFHRLDIAPNCKSRFFFERLAHGKLFEQYNVFNAVVKRRYLDFAGTDVGTRCTKP